MFITTEIGEDLIEKKLRMAQEHGNAGGIGNTNANHRKKTT